MFRFLTLISSGFTTLFGMLAVTMLVRFHDGDAAALTIKLAVGLTIVTISAVTAAHAWGKLGAQRLVLIGAMLLLAIGSAGVPWAYHVGRVTGDFEYWVMMFEMILVGQAAVTILHLWQQRTATVTRQGA